MTREELALISEQATGMAACIMLWATQADVWPGFAAWFEQACPEETWNEEDRKSAAVFGVFLGRVSQGLERLNP